MGTVQWVFAENMVSALQFSRVDENHPGGKFSFTRAIFDLYC
jgi:hypothetical protein